MMGKQSCDEGRMTAVICPSFEINLIEALKLVHHLPLKLFDFAGLLGTRKETNVPRVFPGIYTIKRISEHLSVATEKHPFTSSGITFQPA